MAQQKQQPSQQDRDELSRHGIDAQHHDPLLALKPEVQARGVNWTQLLQIIGKLGANAPAVIALLQALLGGGGTQKSQTAAPAP